MKFTTTTALFAISASVASAAPAYNTQVSISKAATTTPSYIEQPSIIPWASLENTLIPASDYSTPSVVSTPPVSQLSNFMLSGIPIHTIVPTTIVKNGMTTVSNVESVTFLHFGPGPARFSPRTSTTPSSTVAAYTSTPVIKQAQAASTSAGLPFTLHFGFPAQATMAKSSYSSVASSSTSGYVIPSYKKTVYSTVYAQPSTISVVVAPKSTITSVVFIPGKQYTVYETIHQQPSAKPYVTSSSAQESVTYNNRAAAPSSTSSSGYKLSVASVPSLPFTLHYGFPMQHSTLVTSVRPSTTTAAPYVGSVPTVVVYSTTSFIKTTPVAAYTSAPSATATSTAKKYFFGIF